MDQLASPAVRAEVVAAAGAFALLDVHLPAGAAVPLHVVAREDLLVYVLEGAADVWLRRDRLRLGAGDHLHVPRDAPRAITALRDTRVLCVAVPSGIEQLAATLLTGDLDADDRAALLTAGGVELLRGGPTG